MSTLTQRIPIPTGINSGIVNARQTTMLSLLGNPRPGYDNTCRPVVNARLKKLIDIRTVGPLRVQGLKPALDSLAEVLDDVRSEQPAVHAALGTAGMLCARLVRGSATAISNHSWGSAIDLTVDGVLDTRGDGKVQRGLALIAPIFNRHGWFWGAGFSTEDAMHFECGDAMVRQWHAKGLLVGAPSAVPPDVLSLGDRGESVRALQQALNRGGAGLVEDGDFGPATRAAVIAFQAAAGLAVDGIAGAKTIAALTAAAQPPIAA